MNAPFFVQAQSAEELLSELHAIDIDADATIGHELKFQKERQQLCHFLSTYAESFQFPLRVRKSESPDFCLRDENRNIGIECVEAVTNMEAQIRKELRKNEYSNAWIHWSPPDPSSPKLSGKKARQEKIDSILKGKQGPPWYGDAPEREWAERIYICIKEKIKTASKPGFKHFEHNWLLVRNSSPLSRINLDLAIEHFHQSVESDYKPLPFQRVFVETSGVIVDLFSPSKAQAVVNDLWPRQHQAESP